MGDSWSLIQTLPSRSTQMFRMFLIFSSIFCVAGSLGPVDGPFLGSVRKTVVTMKKIRSRNAMSARDDDGNLRRRLGLPIESTSLDGHG